MLAIIYNTTAFLQSSRNLQEGASGYLLCIGFYGNGKFVRRMSDIELHLFTWT